MKKNILLACLSVAMLASCGGPVSESASKSRQKTILLT